MYEITIILILIGMGAGVVGSMLGVGGGIFMSPALTFLGFSPSHVASTSLIAVMSTSASSTLAFSLQRRILYGIGIKMSILSIPGAIAGAYISGTISIELFKIFFAILLIATGIYIVYKSSIVKGSTNSRESAGGRISTAIFYLGSFVAGIVSSLFGIGGGIIFVPMQILLLRISMHNAVSTSQLALLLTSIAGVFTHASLGHPDYLHAISLAAGAFIGAQIGSRLSLKVKEDLLQKLLAFSLVIMALRFIYDWLM